MPRPVDPNKVQAALRLLGLEQAWLRLSAVKPQSIAQAQTLLAQFKDDQLKPAYRALALENHPDRGGDELKMKELSAAFNLLKELTVFKRPRGLHGRPTGPMQRPVGRVIRSIHINIHGGAGYATSTTTVGTATGYVRTDFGGNTDGGTTTSS